MSEEKAEFWTVIPGNEERYLREYTALKFLLSNCETCIWFREGEGLTVQVNCSDTFAWGCADSEDIESEEEMGTLCEMVRDFPKHGGDRWCCFKRNEQPQEPVVKMMKDHGEWCERMEALPLNYYDTACDYMDRKRGAVRADVHANWVEVNLAEGKTLTHKQLEAPTP